ncbi:DUF2190 family protein [Psittacicella hinzii]|uniref:Uncharacterized protein n=1 Tax=Psittacicella hinzii TaxID=2028575 RepID=A0A3A1YFY7_9GAMM|nr:DUF2190 family protein [Psittacicella hinzii]RIY36000.1 hypothetical protein CKF58_06335 [Psittacicella hinzii]
MAHKILDGNTLVWKANRDVKNGELVVFDGAQCFAGVAETDARNGELVTINLTGVYEVQLDNVQGNASTIGAALYKDSSNYSFDRTQVDQTNHIIIGHLWEVPPANNPENRYKIRLGALISHYYK